MRTALIDADSIIHIVAPKYKVGQDHIELLKETTTEEVLQQLIADMYKAMNVETVTAHVDQFIHSILSASKATHYLGFVGNRNGSETFRHKMETTKPYKGNRKSSTHCVKHWKPIIVEHMVSKWGFMEVSNIEADDACTICANHIPGSVICSPDKDLRQIAGDFYDYKSLEHTSVTAHEALTNLYKQCLTGDTTDNIPGCTKVGAKSPFLQFPDCETLEDFHNYTFEVYKKKGVPEMMQEQLTLVFMLRHPDGVDIKEIPTPIQCPQNELPEMTQEELNGLPSVPPAPITFEQ